MRYYHLTNLNSPIDTTDGAFLEVLLDYRIGPPLRTWEKSTKTLENAGVFGLYVVGLNKKARNLTGLTQDDISPYHLGQSLISRVFTFLLRRIRRG